MTKAVKMISPPAGGWHDGEGWREYPPAGEVIVLEDEHADHEVAAGRAEYVKAETRSAETRPAPDTAEKRTVSKSTKDPRALRP
jgi:hypothetical protein